MEARIRDNKSRLPPHESIVRVLCRLGLCSTVFVLIQLEFYHRMWFLLFLLYGYHYTKHRYFGAKRYRKPIVVIPPTTILKTQISGGKERTLGITGSLTATMPWIKVLHERPPVIRILIDEGFAVTNSEAPQAQEEALLILDLLQAVGVKGRDTR